MNTPGKGFHDAAGVFLTYDGLRRARHRLDRADALLAQRRGAIPGLPARPYAEPMAPETERQRRAGAIARQAALGVTVTSDGIERAGDRLDDAVRRHGPDYWERLRSRLGLPTKAP